MSTAASVAAREPLGARAFLWLALFASGLLLARIALRGIHVPGHAALPALFFLVLGAERVRRAGAATATALPTVIAGVLGFAGDAGGAAALALTACAVEAAAYFAPAFSRSLAACVLVGLAAGAARLAPQLVALLTGAPDTGAPLLASLAGYAGFGALGAALACGVGKARAPKA